MSQQLKSSAGGSASEDEVPPSSRGGDAEDDRDSGETGGDDGDGDDDDGAAPSSTLTASQLGQRPTQPAIISVDGHEPGPLSRTQPDTRPPSDRASTPGSDEPRRSDPFKSGTRHQGPVADPLIGLIVAGRYRIVERVGRGGMGIVYRVEHTSIGKLLAMKLLAGELSSNEEVVRRFKLEALTVSKLSCPHTVQVFDYGVWNHLTYLVMELVEGQDLGRVLRKRGPLPFSQVGRLIVQVCDSLAEAHEKGITHRDVKPENIMIVSDARGGEVAKVLDFGLAKLRESTELNEVTLQGAVVGTPYFMSPEQVHGEEVDGRSDIYSLGAVMFRVLTGTYPFEAKTPMGMFTKHLTAEPPSANERAPELEIPTGVSDAIQRCMAKERRDRFQTVEELRDLLLEELSALPLSSSERLFVEGRTSEAPSGRKRATSGKRELLKSQIATRAELDAYERKLRRTRYGAWALMALLFTAALGGAGYLWQASRVAFAGGEVEPNNTAAEANNLRLGEPIVGYIGKRYEPSKSDRDFFAFELKSSHIDLTLDPLPNMPLCALIYRTGYREPQGHYCSGHAGLGLHINNLTLEPGNYLVAVTQDLTSETGAPRYVLENVSDNYRLVVSVATPAADAEIEPNDHIKAPQRAAPGQSISGMLGWVGDEDHYCADSEGKVVWRVSDGERRDGTLEVTPFDGGAAAPLVRIHPEGRKPVGRPRLDADVNSPWQSEPFAAKDACLRIRLTRDPWSSQASAPRPSDVRYTVELVSQ